MKNKEENTILNMASCMLSIYDSLKLEDNNSRDKSESLTEVMFRKMEAYDVDLNVLLDFTHLKPIQAKVEDKVYSRDEVEELVTHLNTKISFQKGLRGFSNDKLDKWIKKNL